MSPGAEARGSVNNVQLLVAWLLLQAYSAICWKPKYQGELCCVQNCVGNPAKDHLIKSDKAEVNSCFSHKLLLELMGHSG